MGRPKPHQAMIRNARAGHTRVEVPRATCGRCGQTGIYALPTGEPRPHLRPAVQGLDPGWSEIVPVRVTCGEQPMTIEEFYESVPEALRIAPGTLPPEIAEAFAFMNDRNALLDAGMPVAELPTIGEWRASRGE